MNPFNPPATPPRASPPIAPITPCSTKCHKKQPRARLASPGAIPLVSPFDSTKKQAPDVIDSKLMRGKPILLPTPLTVGTGRKSKTADLAIQPSQKSKNLTKSLEALCYSTSQEEPQKAREPEPQTPLPPLISRPSTPPLQITHKTGNLPLLEDAFHQRDTSKNERTVEVVSVDCLKSIPRESLANPFVEPTPHHPKRHSSTIDFSTHMELVHNKTGRKKLERLDDEQRRFKPRKLDFSLVDNPIKTNYNIANKFVKKSIGKTFALDDSLKPGFEIFTDEEDA